jgi:hypothetical protein
MAFYHGKAGKVTMGSGPTTMKVKSWKAKVHKDEADVTNTTSAGFREFQVGLKHVEFTIEAEWDATLHPFATPIDIQTIDSLTVNLYTASTDTNPVVSGSGVIFDCDIDLSVENVVKYTITGKTTGTPTFNAS